MTRRKVTITMAEARTRLKRALEADTEHTRYFVEITLFQVSGEINRDAANELIEEFNITEKVGIRPYGSFI